jgi:hypothetical protein
MREAILNYYSTTRKDEDIINNLNNIAFNEGVYLEDMDLEYLKIDGQEDPIKLMSLKNIEAIPVSTMNADSTVIGATPDLAISEAVDQISLNSKISYIGTTLLGSGDYYQIKNFLVAANKIGLLNNVQSFNISKDEDGNAEEGGDPNKLSFKLVIGFGYFKESKSQVVDLIGSPVLTLNGFDFKDIEKNKDLLTGNYQKSEVGETGLANPFIP